MQEGKKDTHFLPAETAEPEAVARQIAQIEGSPVLMSALNGIQGFAMILNRARQVVFLNDAFKAFLKGHGLSASLGERQGVFFGCSHASEGGGCGTTEACARCGAARAQARALEGAADEQECRILSRNAGDELDLRVKVQPLPHEGEEFLLVSLTDISGDKRREVLERLFFHDIVNTAGGVQGLIDVMLSSGAEEISKYLPPAQKAADKLMAQILSQKDLSAAERGELKTSPEDVDVPAFMREMAELFRAHEAARRRTIEVVNCEGIGLHTDKTLLSRVIGNMLKNAVEAEPAGAVITLSCEALPGGGAAFSVKNPTPMGEDARLQVFQRSFSTKGEGRGLGTYSIRLFTERYLKGAIRCDVSPAGTVFRAEYPASI